MDVMLIGGGGREHAITKYILKNPEINKLYVLPGNGGISKIAECVNIDAENIPEIINFAREKNINFAVVAPDDPLAMGLVDELENVGVKCFGPDKKAAQIESSKIFSKNLMRKYNIPTADYEIFDSKNIDRALSYAAKSDFPIVIKADGLAKGKGVTVAENFKQARDAVISCMKNKIFGSSGENILIEKFLTGPEVTVMSFTDGNIIIPLISSMDHKRINDGNKGANTGGMGVIAPNFYYSDEIADECMKKIFIPTLNALKSENIKFKGCLYFGLILTSEGPKVLEYNSRFGDPETQAVLPLLKTDLFKIMQAVRDEKLNEIKIEFENKYSCCVVLASGGYPGQFMKGFEIEFDQDELNKIPDIEIFHAGTKFKDGKFYTSGGRVLAINSIGETPENARSKVYEAVKFVNFENKYFRSDIGAC